MKPIKLFYLLPITLCVSIFTAQFSQAQTVQPFAPPANTCPFSYDSPLPSPPLSQEELSVPSLWLAQEQFGGKLLNQWFVEPGKNWVVLIVNRQIWSLLDYLERYQFVNRFGTAARQDGYNIRVCNPQGATLAVYTCNFSERPANPEALNCRLELDSLNQGGFRGQRKLF